MANFRRRSFSLNEEAIQQLNEIRAASNNEVFSSIIRRGIKLIYTQLVNAGLLSPAQPV